MLRLGAVGDVVRTLPAAAALRDAYPRAHLAWCVEPAAASVLAGQSWLDEVMVFPRPALAAALRAPAPGRLLREAIAFARELRGRRFDLVVDFHAILRSAVLGLATGAPMRVTYARPAGREGAPLLATHRARLAARRASRFERNADLVAFLGVDSPPPEAPLELDPAALARMRAALAGVGPAAVIHPGVGAGRPHKRYPAASWAEVARALSRDGARVFVAEGPAPEERAFARAVIDAAGGAARSAPTTPGLSDLAALFAACDVALAPDAGPLHLAALVGTPVVQVLGSTDAVENAPLASTPSRVVRAPLGCSPCRRGCAAATCMRAIPPRAVVEAASDLLAGAHTGAAEATA